MIGLGSMAAGLGASMLGEVPGMVAGEIGAGFAHGRANQMADRSEKFGREMFAKQTDLANTAYQRSVSDMRKAGLNPTLMFGGHSAVPGTSLGATASGAQTAHSFGSGRNPFSSIQEVSKLNTAQMLDRSSSVAQLSKAFVDTGRGKVQNTIGDVLKDVSDLVRSNATTARSLDGWLDRQAEAFGRRTAEAKQAFGRDQLQRRENRRLLGGKVRDPKFWFGDLLPNSR